VINSLRRWRGSSSIKIHINVGGTHPNSNEPKAAIPGFLSLKNKKSDVVLYKMNAPNNKDHMVHLIHKLIV
jgi:hypothetical protein